MELFSAPSCWILQCALILILVAKSKTQDPCPGPMVEYEDETEILSPNFGDGNYANDNVCSWIIVAHSNQVIRIYFPNFNVEESDDCTADFLEIFDGANDDDSDIIAVLCGTDTPSSITSSGPYMYLKFVTDGSGTALGFRIDVSFRGTPDSDACPGPRRIEASGVEIASPNFGAGLPYSNNDYCNWVVVAGEDQSIRVHFFSFDVDESNGCSEDSLQMYDGIGTDSEVLTRLCGYFQDIPQLVDIQSSGRFMHIIFETNVRDRAPGFHLRISFRDSYAPAVDMKPWEIGVTVAVVVVVLIVVGILIYFFAGV